MSLYYPPKQGLKGSRPEHWPTGVIPTNLANAMVAAVSVGKESIHDSNTEWLILDGTGNIPSKFNMHLQPESQLIRADYYGKILPTAPVTEIPTITIDKPYGTITPPQITQASWLMENWKWAVPAGLGVLFLLFTDG